MTLLPERIDNFYDGRKSALWLFGLIVFLRTAMSVNSILKGDRVARFADGVALDSFTPAGAHSFLALFAVVGFANLVICFLCLLALVLYRAMVPLMFAVLLLEQIGRRTILYVMPIARTGKPPGLAINLALIGLTGVGLVLSLSKRPGDAGGERNRR